MDWLKNPILIYVGMFLAVAGMVLGIVMPEYASYAWTFAALLGVGSAEVLRQIIDSKGWKTHAAIAVIVLSGVAQLAGWIDQATFYKIFGVFAPVTGLGIYQALAKSPTSNVPKLNGG
jgi:hypothetical protein